MAIEHSSIGTGEIHEPKGAATALVDQVYVSNGAGSGVWAVPPSPFVTEVIVQSASDFPDPVSGVITLADGVLYLLDGNIDVTSNRFVLGAGSSIEGLGTTHSSLTTTNAGIIFTATDSFELARFTLHAASGTIFGLTGTGTEHAELFEFFISSCASLGLATTWHSFLWDRGEVGSFTSPLTFSGACDALALDKIYFKAGYTTAIDLATDSPTFNVCDIWRCEFDNAAATDHIKIHTASQNINAGYEGRISFNEFKAGPAIMITGHAQGDLQWKVFDNTNTEDTAHGVHAYTHVAATTVIAVTGTPQILTTGTWTPALEDQFSLNTTTGVITYLGLTKREVQISAAITGTSSGAATTFAFEIAKNGTVQTGTRTLSEFVSTAVASPATCMGMMDLETGDELAIYVTRTIGSQDWDTSILNIMAHGVA